MDNTGHDRVRQVIAGEFLWADLDPTERAVANAALDAAINEVAASTSFAQDLLKSGQSAIVLNDAGVLIRLDPDGSSTNL